MADFCKQCSIELFGKDFGDMAGLVAPEDEGKFVANVLCEGCGPTQVNGAGECVYHKGRTMKECHADTVKSVPSS